MYGTTIHQSFQPVTQRQSVKTFCPQCQKKRTIVVSRQYYRNGFHNESETRAENQRDIDKESREAESKGVVCGNCEKINAGIPELKKLSSDKYAAFSRKTGKPLGIIHRSKDEWRGKWVVFKPKRDYSDNLEDAAVWLRDMIEGKPKQVNV